MAIIDKKQFLETFASKNKAAKKVSFLWETSQGAYYERILNANLGIINTVNVKAELGAEWYEQFQLFLYKEFIEKPKVRADSFYGRIKQNEFGQHKENCTGNTSKKEPFESNVLPLLKEFIDYKKQRVHYKEEAPLTKTLIITALPLEFRAVVRRLDFIINIEKIDIEGTEATNINTEIANNDAFDFAMNLENDTHRPSSATDITKKYDRPYILYVDGIFGTEDGKKERVVIMLPSIYGWESTKNAVEKCVSLTDYGNYFFKEVIVCGVAGSLANKSDLQIGDLLISNKILGSDTFSEISTQNDGIIDDIKLTSERKWEDEINYNNNWIPTLLISKPDENCGFTKVQKTGFLSINSVTKVEQKKEIFKQKYIDKINGDLADKYCGVEMEGYGAKKFFSDLSIEKKVIIVKSISDYCDGSKSKEWQPYCADVASSFVYDYLTKKI